MMHSKDYDFSFSGLKTAVLYETRGKKLTKDYIANVCFEVQQAIIDVLLKKTIQAAKDYKVKTIILGGGVSANKELRKQLGEKIVTSKNARDNILELTEKKFKIEDKNLFSLILIMTQSKNIKRLETVFSDEILPS